ncbi:MAG: hypothetical protein EOM53_04750 [Alphaproteobacteria bacterium]|nr:hypothetical protein [Alphaproteobacteria bacterium]
MKKRKLKIAIQLFGHLRTYKKCYRSLYENLIKNYECDVFIHTWDKIDHNTQTWHGVHMKSREITDKNVSLYAPKGIKIEPQVPEDLGLLLGLGRKISIFGMKSMFHSLYECNLLREAYAKEHKKEYDFVVCVRPDLVLLSKFNIEDFIKKLTAEEVSASVFRANFLSSGVTNDFKHLTGSDLLFFAKPETMSKALFLKEEVLQKMIENKFEEGKQSKDILPEYYWIEALEKAGIKQFALDYHADDFYILRGLNKVPSFRELRKNIIRFHVKKKGIKLYLFPKLNRKWIRLQGAIGSYSIDIVLGRR